MLSVADGLDGYFSSLLQTQTAETFEMAILQNTGQNHH
jgi:hypothetical protein